MVDLYLEYLRLKKIKPEQIYLFKQGAFYLALGDDAEVLNQELGLKLKYEMVYFGQDVVVYDLLKLDCDMFSGEEALEKLKEYQIYLKELRNE